MHISQIFSMSAELILTIRYPLTLFLSCLHIGIADVAATTATLAYSG